MLTRWKDTRLRRVITFFRFFNVPEIFCGLSMVIIDLIVM
jgi:hypothetical protein